MSQTAGTVYCSTKFNMVSVCMMFWGVCNFFLVVNYILGEFLLIKYNYSTHTCQLDMK